MVKINKLFWILSLMFLLLLGLASAVPTAPDVGSVIGYYGFDTSIIGGSDYTDNSNDPISNTAVFNSTGKYLGGYSFYSPTSDDKIIYDISSGSYSSTNLSVCAWIYPRDSDVGFIIGKDDAVNRDYYLSLASNNRVAFRVADSSTIIIYSPDNSIVAGNWYYVCGTWTSGSMNIYIDGVNVANATPTGTLSYTAEETVIGGWSKDNVQNFDGNIDEVVISNEFFDLDTVSYLHNGGVVTSEQQWPFVSSVVANFSVSAVDFWDDSSISNFWAFIDGVNYTTTNGTINTGLYQNDTSLYTLQVGAVDYFVESYSFISVSSNFEAVLHQSEISFASYQFITNNSLSSCNYTISGQQNTTFYLSEANDYVVLVECPDSYDKNHTFNVTALDIKIENVTGIYDNLINVSAINARTSYNIASFSGTITQSDNSYSASFSTTNNYSFIPAVNGLNYTLTLNPVTHYASNVGLEQNISLNSSNNEVIFSLYENNSIQFNFYDQNTGATVNNVNVTLESTSNTYSFNTSNGNYFIDNITSNTYTMTARSSGYTNVELFVTVLNGEYQELNVYFGGGLVPKTFFVVDNNGNAIPGVILTFTREINSSTVTYGQKITDFSGAVQISLDESLLYSIIATKTGYDTFTGDVTPFQDSYTINLEETGSQRYVSVYEDISYSHNVIYNNYSLNYALATFNIISSLGYLQYFGLSTTYNGTDYFYNITGSPSGSLIELNISPFNASIEGTVNITYWFKSVNYSLVTWNKLYVFSAIDADDMSLAKNGLSPEGMSDGLKAIIGGIILAILVIFPIIFTKRMFVGAITGILGIAVLWSKEFFDPRASIIAIIVLVVLLIADMSTGATR